MKINYKIIEIILNKNLQRVIFEGRKSLLPPPSILVSDWADANRMLPETSAEPGKWRTKRAEHTRTIMNSVNDPEVRMITIMGSSQWGKTEMMNNIIGYKIDVDPCSVMVMQPTEKDARDYVQFKLESMLNDTPVLRAKVATKKSRNSENTIFRKKFVGGYIIIVSGNSPSATRSRSAKLTIADDIDAIPILFQREGDPILRLIKRSTTYPDHLNINISTPTRAGESRIETLYNQSNMQRYFIDCPHCGHSQTMVEENLYWQKDVDMFGKVIAHYPETAAYRCVKCSCLITEAERIEALLKGKWIAEHPYIKHHVGFFLNELSSSLSTMEKVVRQIIDSGLDIINGQFDFTNAHEEKVEALFNTTFGRTYQPVRGETIEAIDIMDRVENYVDEQNKLIPNEVLLITAAVDVQGGMHGEDQRLELNVFGWGDKEETWLLYRTKIAGNVRDLTSDSAVWRTVDKYWDLKWKRKDGIELSISIKVIDSGFETQVVYDYTAGRMREGLYAIKGATKYGADLLPRKLSPVNKGKTMLLVIGTQLAKHELFSRLKKITAPGPRYIHFPKIYCDADYFKQLAAEQAVRKYVGLHEFIVYEKRKKSDANEAIDLLVYNYAAMKLLNPNWQKLKQNLDKKAIELNPSLFETNELPKERKIIKKKNFVTNW